MHELNDVDRQDLVIVSPDYGGVKRARKIAETLGCGLAIVDKRRPKPNEVEMVNVLGDVAGKICVVIDDIIDTGGTIIGAAKLIKNSGAKKVIVMATHALFNGNAIQSIKESINSKQIDEFYVSDSIARDPIDGVKVISIDKLLAEAINIYMHDGSISHLYDEQIKSLTNKK